MEKTWKILVADDDSDILESLKDRLEFQGYPVITGSDGEEAYRLIVKESPFLVLLDLLMPKMDGIEVLKKIRAEGIDSNIVVMSAYGTIEKAVEALKAGAYDFVTKPFDQDHLDIVIQKVVEREDLRRENLFLHQELESKVEIVGRSKRIREVYEIAKRAAQSKSTILLLGESGTGKEVLASAIHNWSPRKGKPFVPVNCVTLSEELLESELFGHEKGAFTGAHKRKIGKMELANGGTVFLDEIAEIRPSLQARLLRFLQESEFERVGGIDTIKVDIRIIAATNRDLEKEMDTGRFRNDLYYRLNVVTLHLPPLRERKEDIPEFINLFLHKYCEETKKAIRGFSPEAMEILMDYDWPGNVRELENVVERCVVLSENEIIQPKDLPVQLIPKEITSEELKKPFHEGVQDFKKNLILTALAKTRGNKTEAAELLGLQRTYLARLIKNLNLEF